MVRCLKVFAVRLFNQMEVDMPGKPFSKLDKESWNLSLEFLITSFDTGIYYIPPQPFVFTTAGITDTLMSRATYLEVKGVALDTTNTVRDIKAQATEPVTIGEVATYAIPALLLVAVIVLLVLYFRKRKEDQPLFKPVKPEEPPYITALRELAG